MYHLDGANHKSFFKKVRDCAKTTRLSADEFRNEIIKAVEIFEDATQAEQNSIIEKGCKLNHNGRFQVLDSDGNCFFCHLPLLRLSPKRFP